MALKPEFLTIRPDLPWNAPLARFQLISCGASFTCTPSSGRMAKKTRPRDMASRFDATYRASVQLKSLRPHKSPNNLNLASKGHLSMSSIKQFLSLMKTSLFKLLLAIASSVSILTFLAGCGNSSAATSATVVLVHGAWADGSSWASVTPILQKQGLKVISVQLPRTSLSDDAAVVTRAVNAQSGAVILVGHSYGGAVITQAGNSPKVAALVYVSAFAPGDGQSINNLTSPFPKPAWESGLIADEAGFLTLSTDTFLNSFGPDVPKDTAMILASAQGPLQAKCLDDKVTAAAWKTKPSWWIYGDQDQIIPPALQQAEAKQLGARITSIPGASHLAIITHADAVAQTILDAATSTGNL